MSQSGVFEARKKNGEVYYRSSMTYRNKHISLGSYPTMEIAGNAYSYARRLIKSTLGVDDYTDSCPLSYEKFIVLINFRDNRVYIKNPIYLQ